MSSALSAAHFHDEIAATAYVEARIWPNGARVAVDGVDRMEIENELLRRNTVYYDSVAFARALGMLPSKDGRTDRLMLRLFNLKTKLRTRRR